MQFYGIFSCISSLVDVMKCLIMLSVLAVWSMAGCVYQAHPTIHQTAYT